MNCYKLLVSTILTLSVGTALAQSEEEAVKATVRNLFDGMRTSDTAKIRAAFATTPVLQTEAVARDGKVAIRTDHVDSFIVSIGKPRKEVLDERITFGSVLIDGDLASVWTPYRFYLGEQFLHCGVNSFQLVRIGGQWKIQYLIDTRRRQGCD